MAFSTSRLQFVVLSIGAAILWGGGMALSYQQAPLPQQNLQLHKLASDTAADSAWVVENGIVLVELTPFVARRALQGFVIYRERFSNGQLAELQGVDHPNTDSERTFLNDLKKLGFGSLTEWRSTLLTLDQTYNVMMQTGEDQGLKFLTNAYPQRVENSLFEINRKIVTSLLQNETERTLLEDLAHIDQ